MHVQSRCSRRHDRWGWSKCGFGWNCNVLYNAYVYAWRSLLEQVHIHTQTYEHTYMHFLMRFVYVLAQVHIYDVGGKWVARGMFLLAFRRRTAKTNDLCKSSLLCIAAAGLNDAFLGNSVFLIDSILRWVLWKSAGAPLSIQHSSCGDNCFCCIVPIAYSFAEMFAHFQVCPSSYVCTMSWTNCRLNAPASPMHLQQRHSAHTA